MKDALTKAEWKASHEGPSSGLMQGLLLYRPYPFFVTSLTALSWVKLYN